MTVINRNKQARRVRRFAIVLACAANLFASMHVWAVPPVGCVACASKQGNVRPVVNVRRSRQELSKLQKKLAIVFNRELLSEIHIKSLVKSLNGDIDRIFQFVRDRLYFHPYRGALRGPRGALLAGAANDVDRSLLLAEMLRQVVPARNVRFARGRLERSYLDQLIGRSLRALPGRPAYRLRSLDADLPRLKLNRKDLVTSAIQFGRSAQPYADRFIGGYLADSRVIRTQLRKAGLTLSGQASDGPGAARTRLARHTWVQLLDKGKWVDLDPSFPQARVGWRPCRATQPFTKVPRSELHRLTLRLVLEQLRDSKLKPITIYERTWSTTNLAGKAISLTIMPERFNLKSLSKRPTQGLTGLAAKFDRYQVQVDWGAAREQSRVFDLKGRAFASRGGIFSEMGGIVGSRIGALLSRRSVAPAFAALRLEMHVQSPGEVPHKTVRYVVDRLKPQTRVESGMRPRIDRRLGLTQLKLLLCQSWTIWPATGALNDTFCCQRLMRLFSANGAADLMMKLAGSDGLSPEKFSELARKVDPLPLHIIGFVRTALYMAQTAFEPSKGACFMDRPSLFLWKEGLSMRPGGPLTYRSAVDIAYAPLGCVSHRLPDTARARFLYGLLLSEGESATVSRRGGRIESTTNVFAAARQQGSQLLVLRNGPLTHIPSLKNDPLAMSLVKEEFKLGNVVIIPANPVQIAGRKTIAWWRVNPRTGMCLGIGATGEGMATSEGVLILKKISIPMVKRVMKFVICFNLAIGQGASMQSAGAKCGKKFMKSLIEDTLKNAIDQFVLDPSFFAGPPIGGPTGRSNDWLAGTTPGHRGLRESRAISSKMNETAYKRLLDAARRHYNYKSVKGLAGRVNLILTLGRQIAKVANARQ